MSASSSNTRAAELDRLLEDDLRDEMLIAEVRNRIERRRYQKDLLLQEDNEQSVQGIPSLVRSPSRTLTGSANRYGTVHISGLDGATRAQVLRGEASIHYTVKAKFSNVNGWQSTCIHIWEPDDPYNIRSANSKVDEVEQMVKKTAEALFKHGSMTRRMNAGMEDRRFVYVFHDSEARIWVDREVFLTS